MPAITFRHSHSVSRPPTVDGVSPAQSAAAAAADDSRDAADVLAGRAPLASAGAAAATAAAAGAAAAAAAESAEAAARPAAWGASSAAPAPVAAEGDPCRCEELRRARFTALGLACRRCKRSPPAHSSRASSTVATGPLPARELVWPVPPARRTVARRTSTTTGCMHTSLSAHSSRRQAAPAGKILIASAGAPAREERAKTEPCRPIPRRGCGETRAAVASGKGGLSHGAGGDGRDFDRRAILATLWSRLTAEPVPGRAAEGTAMDKAMPGSLQRPWISRWGIDSRCSRMCARASGQVVFLLPTARGSARRFARARRHAHSGAKLPHHGCVWGVFCNGGLDV